MDKIKRYIKGTLLKIRIKMMIDQLEDITLDIDPVRELENLLKSIFENNNWLCDYTAKVIIEIDDVTAIFEDHSTIINGFLYVHGRIRAIYDYGNEDLWLVLYGVEHKNLVVINILNKLIEKINEKR